LHNDNLQALIRHCWEYNIYNKKQLKISSKEKFINFIMIDGKKAKAYKLFNKAGLLTRKKILQNWNQKPFLSFENRNEFIQQAKTLFLDEMKTNSLYKESIKGGTSSRSEGNVSQKKSNIHSFESSKQKIPSFNQILLQAIENIKPSLEVRKVRIAGTTYLVPALVAKARQETLAIKWIIQSARKRKRTANFPFADCLANELVDAFFKQGQARQKRDELHKLAEANRAYTRYRWW
jgi:ribosomal protein S7